MRRSARPTWTCSGGKCVRLPRRWGTATCRSGSSWSSPRCHAALNAHHAPRVYRRPAPRPGRGSPRKRRHFPSSCSIRRHLVAVFRSVFLGFAECRLQILHGTGYAARPPHPAVRSEKTSNVWRQRSPKWAFWHRARAAEQLRLIWGPVRRISRSRADGKMREFKCLQSVMNMQHDQAAGRVQRN